MKKLQRICILSFLFVSQLAFGQKDTVGDSLKFILESANEDTAKVNLLVELSTFYSRSSGQEAIQYGIEARDLAQTINFQEGEAQALKYIGMAYYHMAKYYDAITYWQSSFEISDEIGDLVGVSNMQNNIGTVYFNQGDDNKAIDYYLLSLINGQKANNKLRIATALVGIGNVYLSKPLTYDKALDFFLYQALPICKEINDLTALGTTYVNIGEIYLNWNRIDSALFYFEKSRITLEQSGVDVSYTLNNMGKAQFIMGDIDLAFDYHQQAFDQAKRSDSRLHMSQALIGLGIIHKERGDFIKARDAFQEAKDIANSIETPKEEKEAVEGLAITYAKMGEFPNAYQFQILYGQLKDTIYNAENEKRITALIQDNKITRQEGDIKLNLIEIKQQKIVKKALLVGLLLIFIIAFIIFRNYLAKVKVNKILDKQNEEIDGLLLNILPEEVARELQEFGYATPRDYKSVSVLFTDFKGFSSIAKDMDPADLVNELSSFFVAFDKIIDKYNLEKIKTIGDAYMCAGGIPSPNESHPEDTLRAGLEMQMFMKENNVKRRAEGKVPWYLRVGIHTGPLVAGVVGEKKYAYDIWGSTVNIASRMESNGEVGKVNVSQTTYDLINHKYSCQHRGKIYAKNVGDIDMYFVEEN